MAVKGDEEEEEEDGCVGLPPPKRVECCSHLVARL